MTTKPYKVGRWRVGLMGAFPGVTMLVAVRDRGKVMALASFSRPRWRPWGRYWLGVTTTLHTDSSRRSKTWNAPLLRRKVR